MTGIIHQTLNDIEKKHHVTILYAVESGSRAWGFASPDSDYDVRYVYVRPAEDYLRIDPLPDTIEGPLDEVLDFSGWDIRKMLGLLRKSNPSLMEWVRSPVVYRTSAVWEHLVADFPGFFSPTSNMHHYLSMAQGNWQKNMRGDRVKPKSYLYVLRPLLCCRWLEKFGTVPPVPFHPLRSAVLPPQLEPVVEELLQRKLSAEESELTAHIPELDSFLLQEISRLRQVLQAMPESALPGCEKLNAMFLEALAHTQEK